ncbi:phosphoheptose isomerase [Sinobacterium caligoides]|uniref:Phosphoheptose isomerase n=1 Tax=Sinobacterium caligoides TaxID=933926 RepID=A0A3N2D4S0_9GAMM|nr:SIS domain-containing protein [Sinobacterium caligoides]ROR94795.1 phosphoheptose isomerase [Sinobacterium caligoides]
MPDIRNHIAEQFAENIETISMSMDPLADAIADAGELIVHSLLHDRKILACGNGAGAALAQLFTSSLLNRFAHERPSLPALNLNADGAVLSGIADDNSYNEVFSKQIKALAHCGDILLIFATNSNAGSLVQAVRAAHDRELCVIFISGADEGDAITLLDQDDIELCIPSDNLPRIIEGELLILHCICELIDGFLFGCEESEA